MFSEADLNAIAEFYNSDAGKKLISDGPIVTRELFKAADIWQRGIARDLAAERRHQARDGGQEPGARSGIAGAGRPRRPRPPAAPAEPEVAPAQ